MKMLNKAIFVGKDVDYRGIRGAGPTSGVNSIRVAGVRRAGAGVPEVITPEQVYARAEMLLKSGKLTPQQCKDLEDQIREVQRRREKGEKFQKLYASTSLRVTMTIILI